jgi:hypothetical protein
MSSSKNRSGTIVPFGLSNPSKWNWLAVLVVVLGMTKTPFQATGLDAPAGVLLGSLLDRGERLADLPSQAVALAVFLCLESRDNRDQPPRL